MERAYVYLICLPDGGIYVGKALDPEKRFESHRRKSSNERVRRSISKHGVDEHDFLVLELHEAPSRREAEEQAYEAESFWINYLCMLGADLVNQTAGGLGLIDPSNASREKMRQGALGNKRCVGRVLSEETRKKISAAARAPTEEQRRKMSAAASKRTGEKNSFFGRKHTHETRAKISVNNGSRKTSLNSV